MVSETILGTLLGVVVGAILTGGFNYLNTRQQINAEMHQLLGQSRDAERVVDLKTLNADLEECYSTLNRFSGVSPSDPDLSHGDYEITLKAYRKFRDTVNEYSIWLNENEEALREAVELFGEVVRFYEWCQKPEHARPPESPVYRDTLFGEFDEAYETAKESLKRELYGPVERLSS